MQQLCIIGSRGIPNQYGGFEQFATVLAVGLQKKGFECIVYTPHHHAYRQESYHGVKLVRCYDPRWLGAAGQMIYDLLCILDSRKRSGGIIYQLGYTSSALWNFLFRKDVIVVTNLDGMEWNREKYGFLTKLFLHFSERLVVKRSDALVADSTVIRDYVQKKYEADAVFLSYSAAVPAYVSDDLLREYGISSENYLLLIARMQPDNNIEMIIRGVLQSGTLMPLIVVGRLSGNYARGLEKKYRNFKNIRFVGAIYDVSALNGLRSHCFIYFHGHSAGGTNPSLLEAMACKARIAAHRNLFNEVVLGDDAVWFGTSDDIASLLNAEKPGGWWKEKTERNIIKIKTLYSEDRLTEQYALFFKSLIQTI